MHVHSHDRQVHDFYSFKATTIGRKQEFEIRRLSQATLPVKAILVWCLCECMHQKKRKKRKKENYRFNVCEMVHHLGPVADAGLASAHMVALASIIINQNKYNMQACSKHCNFSPEKKVM